MLSKIFRRNLVNIPNEEILSDIREILVSSDKILNDYSMRMRADDWRRSGPLDILHERPFAHFGSLAHPLSEVALRRRRLGPRISRTALEIHALDVLRMEWQSTLNGRQRLQNVLEATASVVLGKRATVRTGNVGIKGDREGHSIQFAQANSVLSQIERIEKWLTSRHYPIGCAEAVVLMGLLLNAHPFLDGNGRVARIAFNAVISDRSLPYVPLYEFFTLSAGGFEIRLRDSELNQSWAQLGEYINSISRIIFNDFDEILITFP